MRIARFLLRCLLWIGLLLIALPLLLISALMTEPGSGWLLKQAPDLMRPLGIEFDFQRSQGSLLGRLQLQGVRVTAAGSRFEAEHLLLQWRPLAIAERRLHILSLELADARVLLPVAEESAASVPQIPDLGIPVTIQLDSFQLDRLHFEQGETLLTVSETALAASFDAQGLTLRNLRYRGGGVQLAGMLGMQTSAPHALTGELSIDIDQSLTGTEVGAVQAGLRLTGSALQPDLELTLTAPTALRLQGSLQLDQLQPGFDLAAEWPELNWPLQGVPTVTASGGRLALRGTSSDYRLELNTRVSGDGIPPADIELTGQGNLQEMALAPLRLVVLDGSLQADGTVAWNENIRWDLQLLAEAIDPGRYLPEWPGRISGSISLGGTFDDRLALQAAIQRLEGELRGQRISASGGIDYREGVLQANRFELASGPNRLYLDGRAKQRLDLKFDINAPDLASLYPGLSGRLEGAGQLGGTLQAPAVSGKLNGQSLAYQETRVHNIELNLDWQEKGGKGELRLSGIDAQGTRIDSLSVDLTGTPAAHRLDLALQAPAYNGDLSAKGGIEQRSWAGELTSLRLDEANLGEWLLQDPVRLQLSETLVQAGNLCLTQGGTALCAEGGWSTAKGMNLSGGLERFDLARLAEMLPGDAVINGGLRGEFKLNGTPADPRLFFRLDPGDGSIELEDDTQRFQLAYRNAGVTGRFENDRGSADLNFELGSQGRAQGSLQLGPQAQGTRSLRGQIAADFPDLALVAGFVPLLEQVKGRLHLETALGGTLAKPQINGGLQIENATALLPAAGITLSDIDLQVRGEGNKPLQVQGQIQSGGGRLNLDGQVDIAAASAPEVDLRLKGDSFEAVKLIEAQVYISPDLRLQGSSPYHLSGSLLIPKAAIELKELPSGTVDVSEDEIVIGEDSSEERRTGAQNLTASVRVTLGKEVTFKGFGLKTGLTGAVDSRVESIGTSVNGKIELRDGTYKSYGQDLKVERGRLLFAGPPDNPDVDLRAVRLSRDKQVKAILAVNGPLSKPSLRVYSEPSLSDTEALAYLLTGNGLSQADRDEGLNIAAAALSMGVSKGEPLLQQFSDELGLDELRVESGDSGLEESSLILGKYLNPDLYVGYSQGLFNPEGAVLLRLRLSERLEVESRSGNEQSVDLFYRLEHD